MITFEKTLEHFQDYILTGNLLIEKEVITNKKLSAKSRLNIYRKGYYLRLVEILEFDFPKLKVCLGKKRFDQLARQYIDAYPSENPSILYFSQYFVDFLMQKTNIPRVYKALAQFEWAMEKAALIEDVPCLTMDTLASISLDKWSGLYFNLHPSVHLHQFDYDIEALWWSVSENQKTMALKKASRPINIMVWVADHEVCFLQLSEEEYFMLSSMQQGHMFETICEGLRRWFSEEELGNFAAKCLQQWVLSGVFHHLLRHE